jgi:hypothetical protein
MTIWTVIPFMSDEISIIEASVKSFTTNAAAISYADDTSDCCSIVENEVAGFIEDVERLDLEHLINGTYQVVGQVSGNVYLQDTREVCQKRIENN